MTDNYRGLTLVEKVLIEGLQDVLMPDWIYAECNASLPAAPLDSRSVAMGVIAELLINDLVLGRTFEEGTWEEWLGDKAQLLELVVQAWLETGPLGPPPTWSIAQFVLSSKGRQRALQILERK